MSTLERLLKKIGAKRENLAADLLHLTVAPSPHEATDLMAALYSDSDGFNTENPDFFRAATLCLEWGARYRPMSVKDIMLTPITTIQAESKIVDAMDFFEHSGSQTILLTKNGQWVGAIDSQTAAKAIRHGLGQEKVQLISCGKPPSISMKANVKSAIDQFSQTHMPILIVIKDNRIVGFLDRESICSGLKPRRLPDRWEERITDRLHLVKAVGEAAAHSGSEAYMVGGSVRDILLANKPNDLDFTIIGDVAQCARHLHEKHGGELHTEPLFGGAHWTSPSGIRIDLTTGRSERYEKPGALPAVGASHLRCDLKRRDFTINMMAINVTPKNWGELIDPFGGLQDLASGHMRVISGLSMTDDPTRIFRAARYGARLNLALHLDTADHLKNALRTNLRESLSLSRLGKEMELIFADQNPGMAISLLKQWGVLKHFWEHEFKSIYQGFLNFEEALNKWHHHSPNPVAVGWTLFGSFFPSEQRKALSQLASRSPGSLKRWLANPDILNAVSEDLSKANPSAPAVWGRAFHNKPLEILVALDALQPNQSEALTWWRETGIHIQFAVSGKQLLKEGGSKGPLMGQALRAAQAAAWSGKDEKGQLKAALDVLNLEKP